MTQVVTPVQDDVYTALKAYVVSVTGLAAGQVIKGLGNRVAMPIGPFVAMTAVSLNRLRTNQHAYDTTRPNPTIVAIEAGYKLTIQLDCYGPEASDWAAMLSELFRDDYACQILAPACQPLYCDDPQRMPIVDAEQQYEDRWTLAATVQYNPTTTPAQEFAQFAAVTTIDVEEAYPI